ncbi:MAG TPA: BON domain-containing protein [Gemmataceae bacterium]|nr:BON domain-containing protein [Gemmataceae bacterium]
MTTATVQQSRAAVVLRESPIPALRRLLIEETEAIVLIKGKVPSYYLKQMAQEAIMPLLDGRVLDNRVLVVGN